jgi:GNAT superfamily N-acetyltransferase
MPEYRPASVADLTTIHQLAHAIWPVVYRDMISREQIEYMLQWMYHPDSLQQQVAEGARFWLAMNQDEPLGFASAQETEPGLFKLHKLYVVPHMHGTGLGKGLLETVTEYARRHGGRRLQLQVNRGNPARDFYEKRGFRILRTADFDIGGGFWMNDYIMEKDLQLSF